LGPVAVVTAALYAAGRRSATRRSSANSVPGATAAVTTRW
jgi:hypothetical protein